MKINNMNILKVNIDNKDMNSPVDIKVGDIINAKIISIVDNLLTLQLNNDINLTARDLSNTQYTLGDKLDFIVTEKEDNKVIIKSLISNEQIEFIKDLSANAIVEDNKKSIMKALLKNDLPITEDNIKTIEITEKYYGKLKTLLDNNVINLDKAMLDQDIRKAIKIIINNLTLSDSEKHNENLNSNNDIHNNLSTVSKSSPNQGTITRPPMTTINNLSSLDADIYNKNSNNNLDDNLPIISKTSSNSLNNYYINSLSNVSKEKLAFILSNNLDFSVENLKILSDIVDGKRNITRNFKELFNIIKGLNFDKKEKNELSNILNKIRSSILNRDENIKSIDKELSNKLTALAEKTNDKDILPKVNEVIEEIKSKLTFINKLNHNNVFIQIPFNMNDNINNLDLIIKKNEKGKNKTELQDTKILISLNTNNLNLVQSLIQIIDSKLYINFRLFDDKIENLFKSNESVLKDELNKIFENDILFKYNVMDQKDNLLTTIESNNNISINKLDIRV